jgi:hypothetical protein
MKYLGLDQVGEVTGFLPVSDLTPAGEIVAATAAIWRVTVSGVVDTTKRAAAAVLLTFTAFDGTNPSFVAARSIVSSANAPPTLSKAAVGRANTFNALTRAILEDNSPDPDYGF